jgi:hypothetical protein
MPPRTCAEAFNDDDGLRRLALLVEVQHGVDNGDLRRVIRALRELRALGVTVQIDSLAETHR